MGVCKKSDHPSLQSSPFPSPFFRVKKRLPASHLLLRVSLVGVTPVWPWGHVFVPLSGLNNGETAAYRLRACKHGDPAVPLAPLLNPRARRAHAQAQAGVPQVQVRPKAEPKRWSRFSPKNGLGKGGTGGGGRSAGGLGNSPLRKMCTLSNLRIQHGDVEVAPDALHNLRQASRIATPLCKNNRRAPCVQETRRHQ